ncbi:MAG: hypothetical protein KBC30_08895 [Planctomycetes bacterium]|jgi:hypothetical protein|nr:hypothetical protein [Planctomycetota bacterium]HNZ67382.1 hypothetical protein [Planctomycetota bacterium]HPY73987.1 hypothetical protein [Planctomycetota bacterium]HQB01115.1 hypothetical protein [Planctomycetota bacterium]
MKKRFFILSAVIILGWCCCYLFVLRPSEKQIQRSKKSIQEHTESIATLHSSEYDLQEESLLKWIAKKNEIESNIQNICNKVGIKKLSQYSTSILDFRSEKETKLQSLRPIANKLGIKFPIELGFDSISSISYNHWIRLHFIQEIILRFFKICEKKDKGNIISIQYPDLEKEIEKIFLSKIDIEMTIESNYQFLQSFLQEMCKDTEDKTFFLLSEVQIVTKHQDILTTKIKFSALILSPEQDIQAPMDNENLIHTKDNLETVPIWERY